MAPDPRSELAAAQAELQSIEASISAKQAASQVSSPGGPSSDFSRLKEKNDRASLRLELQSLERQKAAAQRKLKAAQVKVRKLELTSDTVDSSDDWKEHTDPNTGSTYFYNAKTGESSWTRPAPAAQAHSPTKAAEPGHAAAKAEEWTEHVDPQSGHTFYYNAATGETSWTKPAPAAQEQQPAPLSLAGGGAVPQDWTEHVDPASGNKFYYNAKTGETSWVQPVQAQPAASPASASEWTENIDPASGQKYYFNTVTQESSWTMPSSALQQSVQPTGAIAA